MIRLGRFVAFFILFAALLQPARAQLLTLADLQSKLIGHAWLSTVEGENRTRTLIVSTVTQKADGIFELVGTYNFTDAKPSPLKDGQVQQLQGNVTLSFISGAGSLVLASAQPDGTFVGTIQYQNGATKPIKFERSAVAAAPTAGPKTLSKDEVRVLVGGKTVTILRLSDNAEFALQLMEGGDLFNRNLKSKAWTGSDRGHWEIDDRGALCMTIGQSAPGCSFFRNEGGKYTMHSSPRAAARYEVISVK